ncbi:MAG: hypothetical protein NWS05_05420 [Polaribacter sp.]|jgi:hypothetical protein|nr:hypothetical protein [Polaribacter sp.]
MKHTLILFIIVVSGCKSGKFFLQEAPRFQLKEAFFEETPSAIKEGNSFAKITFILANTDNIESIEIKGVYFKNQFAKLVSKDSTTFIASIILPKEEVSNENKIPFDLKSDEIMVSYLEKRKEKFALFKIKRKDSLDSNKIPR